MPAPLAEKDYDAGLDGSAGVELLKPAVKNALARGGRRCPATETERRGRAVFGREHRSGSQFLHSVRGQRRPDVGDRYGAATGA
jgi:hypothetical protein